MPFVIGRGFAELQILSVRHRTVCEDFVPGQFAKNAHNSQTVWNILIKFCTHIDTDKMTFIIGRGIAELQILKMLK